MLDFEWEDEDVIEDECSQRPSKPNVIVKDNGTVIHGYRDPKGELFPHREDGPAYISSRVSEWYFNGLQHNSDAPAKVFSLETPGIEEVWYLNGQRHRGDGPAVIRQTGEMRWMFNGILHREDGPAVILNDISEWWQYGRRHRDDGPAVIREEFQEYWVWGIRISRESRLDSMGRPPGAQSADREDFRRIMIGDDYDYDGIMARMNSLREIEMERIERMNEALFFDLERMRLLEEGREGPKKESFINKIKRFFGLIRS